MSKSKTKRYPKSVIRNLLSDALREHSDSTDRSARDGCFCGFEGHFNSHFMEVFMEMLDNDYPCAGGCSPEKGDVCGGPRCT